MGQTYLASFSQVWNLQDGHEGLDIGNLTLLRGIPAEKIKQECHFEDRFLDLPVSHATLQRM
jgi:hypothetical protein